MKPLLFLAAIAAYLCSAVYPNEWLKYVVSVLSLLIVLVVFRSVKRFVQGIGAVFLTIGVALLIAGGSSWQSYVLGFGNMLNILSLFALIPLIALPIQLGRYAAKVRSMIQSKIKHSGALYSVTSLLSYVLSSFMNLATLPMMYHSIRPSLDYYPIEQKERFISRAITHGYSMPILWTPVAPIVGIVVEMTGVKWSAILPIVIPFSLLGLALDWFMGAWIAKRRQKRVDQSVLEEVSAAREPFPESSPIVQPDPFTQPNQPNQRNRPGSGEEKAYHPVQILIAIVVFNGLIFVMEQFMHLSFLLLVSIVVIPFGFAWSLLLGKGKAFLAMSGKMLPEQVLKMKEQFFVFLSAGFMISAIQTTGAGHTLNAWILDVKNFVGADVFLLLIPLIPLVLAFIGLHPAVGLALTAESLNPHALGISVEITAIAMLAGAATAFLMGPYNATAGMMSNLIGHSSYKVSNWNAPFTAAYLVLVMVLLLLLKNGG
ncbi:hypothetical protein ACFQI7_02425 [Paenibacillus allorhizosphaerae]|uniref:Permease n=1 Tax=Paenibacillus allorhizosphaerae TaxID=2849866 RepID=A0ABM8VAX7_9BACL|nr:hypothetical protein [Paenibacillus allorhizosphaerae]CAG7617762.1 hypothetical protein PAECIP111802_00447 [Paenibacillus allorhizosphaerae]